MLVNHRTQVDTKGVAGIQAQKFNATHSNFISRALVVDDLDKQNLAFVRKVFISKVEEALRENNAVAEADYAHLARHWYDRIDTPGTSKSRANFRDYLL